VRPATRLADSMMPTNSKSPRTTFHPLTPDRWADLEQLFGSRGACGGCWCMWPRSTRADFERNKGAANRRAFKRIVATDAPPGLLAYADGAPVGWCALAPRETYVRLERSRILKPVDDQPVWSVICFFVARPFRRHGLSVQLLEAAVAHAKKHGARIVEGYPTDSKSSRSPDVFVWTGLAATFRAAGFGEVVRRSASRPVMRYYISKSKHPRNRPGNAVRSRISQ